VKWICIEKFCSFQASNMLEWYSVCRHAVCSDSCSSVYVVVMKKAACFSCEGCFVIRCIEVTWPWTSATTGFQNEKRKRRLSVAKVIFKLCFLFTKWNRRKILLLNVDARSSAFHLRQVKVVGSVFSLPNKFLWFLKRQRLLAKQRKREPIRSRTPSQSTRNATDCTF